MLEALIQNIATGLLGKLFQPRTQTAAVTSSLSAAQRWAIAAGGVLTRLNQDTFETLQNDFPKEEGIAVLRDWWGINSAAEVKDMLVWLANEGHRRRFEPLYQQIAPLNESQLKQLLAQVEGDEVALYTFIWQNRQRFTKGSLLSWDLARLINVCRFAYTAGYLTEGEAWTAIMQAARALQKAYPSWDALTDSYLLGWQFWQGGATVRNKEAAAAQWLKTSPESPCQRLPWNTSLGG